MNNKFLLSAALILTGSGLLAQSSDRTYAITGKTNNTFYWADIKQVDIASGKVVKTVFDTEKTKHTTTFLEKQINVEGSTKNPTAFGVAACALDTRHNRLYFAPLHFSELRYVDLTESEAEFTVVKSNIIPLKNGGKYQTEESHLTRMVFAADGFGYALTNDSKNFLRFSTNKDAKVEDLGSLSNAPSNKEFSIFEKETGWGGDMVADAFGNLVIVTAKHHVYSVDVRTKVATYLGTISGLPEKYTTNGAAVDAQGNLVVSSANVLEGLYKVSVQDFSATKITSTETPFNASDLANGNMLNQKRFDLLRQGFVNNNAIRNAAKVFPNPVVGKSFNLLLSGEQSGLHQVVLTDLSGKIIQSTTLNLTIGNKNQSISLKNKYTRGSYFVKMYNDAKQLVLSEKIVVQ